MTQIFVNVIGHNGSGKSYVSEKLTDDLPINRVSGDDLRHFVKKHVAYFKDLDLSYPSEKYQQLNAIILSYRFGMVETLLQVGQNVLLEGSGVTRNHRSRYLKNIRKKFPKVRVILIYIDIAEDELIKRLGERDRKLGGKWQAQYLDYKKDMMETPSEGEADSLLIYDQKNYDDIKQKIKELIDL